MGDHMNEEPETPTRYRRALRLQRVMEITGLSRSFLYAAAAAGRFPRPAKCGRASIWDADAVDAWLAARLDGATSRAK